MAESTAENMLSGAISFIPKVAIRRRFKRHFQQQSLAPSGMKDITFITPYIVVSTLICRGERANSQLADIFKALDDSECPHKWPDNV